MWRYPVYDFKNRVTQDDSARKTQAALKMLSRDYEIGLLKIYDSVLTELKSEFPAAGEVKQDSLFGLINELSH